MSRDIQLNQPNLQLGVDSKPKLSSDQNFIISFARKSGGVFDRDAYRRHLESGGLNSKLQAQMYRWNKTSLDKMCNAGLLRVIGTGKYLLEEPALAAIMPPKPTKDFIPGKNHIKLLSKHTDGTLKLSALKQEFADKPVREQQRQESMSAGMLRNLSDNGYLVRDSGKGAYTLTDRALMLLKTGLELPASKTPEPVKTEGVKITQFDRHILEVADRDGVISEHSISAHERRDSIRKRIGTLTAAGLITDGRITDRLRVQIGRAVSIARCRKLTPELLTEMQKQTLCDMRLFLNLTPAQILKHVYGGDKLSFNTDIDLLTRLKVIKKMENYNVYVLDKSGVNLSGALLPNVRYYKSKAYSRPVEVEHDSLVYTAFKRLEQQLKTDGCAIKQVLNDRMLRSEDTMKYGHMRGEYPDLRVIYTNSSGLTLKHDIEIDCGYDGRIISQKLSGFFGSDSVSRFTWMCSNAKQAAKVAKIATGEKSKQLRKHKPLYITYMDKNGNIRNLKWS